LVRNWIRVQLYSPLVKASIKKGDKVGVAGIGGLGHLAIKLAKARGAEGYAFTTAPDKVNGIRSFGAKGVIAADTLDKLKPYARSLDYLISTLPVQYDLAAYAAMVKPNGTYTQVGMPVGFQLTVNNLALAASRVNYMKPLVR
jgi:alcohol dehydrogenase (NADP+)